LGMLNLYRDYVYFASYVQPSPGEDEGLWSNIEDLTKQNVALLTNFLGSLPLASIKPKRVLLQTGAKYYGKSIHNMHRLIPRQQFIRS
jgi:hypothetical protein